VHPTAFPSGCHITIEDNQSTPPGGERSGEGDVDSRIIQVESWRKMEATAHNRAEYRELGLWPMFLCCTVGDKAEVR